MKPPESGQGQWCHSQKKAPKGLRVGVRGQPGQILKDPIVSEKMSRFDSAKPQGDRINQGKNDL